MTDTRQDVICPECGREYTDTEGMTVEEYARFQLTGYCCEYCKEEAEHE